MQVVIAYNGCGRLSSISIMEAVVEFLRTQSTPVTTNTIGQAIDLHPRSVLHSLKTQLHRRGLTEHLVVPSQGPRKYPLHVYQLTPAGRQLAQPPLFSRLTASGKALKQAEI